MMTIDRYLEGQHAIVTGGSRGIGAAIAIALAERGASITLMARTIGDLRAQAAAVEQIGGAVRVVECSVNDESSVERAFDRAE